MRNGSLFTGSGGLDAAVEAVFGARTVWHSEIDPAASRVLAAHWPGIPNHGDITTIDWAAVEPVDILSGGFPCQDVSHAGKRAGVRADTRSGLWSQMAYATDQLRPRYVVVENVRGLLSAEAHSDVEPCPWCLGDANGEPAVRALGAVLADLADIGYDARWYGLRAADVGAPHGRFRVFILAVDTDAAGERRRPEGRDDGLRATGLVPGTVADAAHLGHERGGPAWGRRPGPADSGRLASTDATADTDRDGLARIGREQPLERDADRRRGPYIAWGPYEPAIRRWEHHTGRLAPPPTEPGPKSGQRLSPRFVEWMMGLPAGWVTDVPGNTRNDQLRMLGNGVVPQQAAAALEALL